MDTLAIYFLIALALLWFAADWFTQRRALALNRGALVFAFAILIRLAAAWLWGRGDKFDIDSWQLLARLVLEQKNLYADPVVMGAVPRMPWLPFQIYFFAFGEILARNFNVPFVTAVKVLPILADSIIAALVFHGARRMSGDSKFAARVGLLYALNPLTILDVSIHGQFDSIAMLCVLAAWFVFQFQKPFKFNSVVTGVLLGFGILDKTWPLILVPLFLLHAQTWRSRISIAFFAGAVPFAGAMLYALIFSAGPSQIFSTVGSYQSIAGDWGWTLIAGVKSATLTASDATVFGKLLALGSLALYYIFFARKLPLINGILAALLVLLAFAPGLNVYYITWLVPFALLANARVGTRVLIALGFLWLGNFYFGLNPLGQFAPVVAEFYAVSVLLWLAIIGWMVGQLKSVALPRLDPYLALVIAFSVFALAPLLGPGYFWGAHDGRHSVYFLFEFDRAIQDGIFYPRWATDFTFGYGYPFFNIYAPGAYFIGEAFHLFGFEFVTAVKIVFGLAIIFSGVTMFGFMKRLTQSSPAAFISGLAYIYMPYHIVDVYVRANLAETVALVFLPLAFWGFYETIQRPTRLTLVAAALAYGATLFTHNGIALLITPVLGIWVLFLMIGQQRAAGSLRSIAAWLRVGFIPLASLALGIGLASVFAIPAVLEFRFVSTEQWLGNYYDYTNHFVYLYQLFSPFWGFGISKPGPVDDMSFQFGAMPLLLAIFSIVAIARNANGARRFFIFFAALTGVIAILMLSISLPIWEALRITTFAQFPWRLLTLTTISLSILAGAIVLTDENANHARGLSLPAILIGALILLGSFPFLNVPTQVEAKEGPVGILGLLRFQQSANEMTGITAWTQVQPDWSPMADVYFAGRRVKSKIDYTEFTQDQVWVGVLGDGLRADGERVKFTSTRDDYWITFNVFYYPGWRAYLVEPSSTNIIRELPMEIVGEYGRMRARIPRGDHWLMLRFDDTPPRVIGAWVSAASALIVLGLLVWNVRVKRKPEGRRMKDEK